MSAHPRPTLNPENELNETFNRNYFNLNEAYATVADLLSYGNLYTPNNWSSVNTFAAINTPLINGISDTALSYVTYIPNLIYEITNISYNEDTNITTISNTTNMTDTNITDNLNVGQNINCDAIVNTSLINQSISTTSLSCQTLTINNRVFQETAALIYINNITLPVCQSMPIKDFNFSAISSMYITVKSGYRVDFVDENSIILFSCTATDNYTYNVHVPYNTNMISLNVYNYFNVLI